MPISQEQKAVITDAYNVLKRNQQLGDDCTVLLTGSYVTGSVGKNSDVDLIIISRNVTNKSWGESKIKTLKINYAIYPEIQLVSELAVGNTALCLMVYHSLLLCGSNETYNKFKSIVEHIVKKATQPLSDVRRFLMKKKLQNLLDDMDDVKDTDPASLALLRNNLIDYSLHMFAKESQILLTNAKGRLGQVREKNETLYKLINVLLMSRTDTIYEEAQALCSHFDDWARSGGNEALLSEWKIEERSFPSRREFSFSDSRAK